MVVRLPVKDKQGTLLSIGCMCSYLSEDKQKTEVLLGDMQCMQSLFMALASKTLLYASSIHMPGALMAISHHVESLPDFAAITICHAKTESCRAQVQF